MLAADKYCVCFQPVVVEMNIHAHSENVDSVGRLQPVVIEMNIHTRMRVANDCRVTSMAVHPRLAWRLPWTMFNKALPISKLWRDVLVVIISPVFCQFATHQHHPATNRMLPWRTAPWKRLLMARRFHQYQAQCLPRVINRLFFLIHKFSLSMLCASSGSFHSCMADLGYSWTANHS